MNRLWLIILIFLLPCGAWIKIQWASQYRFILAKDEPTFIMAYHANDDAILLEEFEFSWTLFDTKKLVLHGHYKEFPMQHILTLERCRSSVREQLVPDSNNQIVGNTQLLLEFVEFNNEKKLANIDAFI